MAACKKTLRRMWVILFLAACASAAQGQLDSTLGDVLGAIASLITIIVDVILYAENCILVDPLLCNGLTCYVFRAIAATAATRVPHYATGSLCNRCTHDVPSLWNGGRIRTPHSSHRRYHFAAQAERVNT